MEGYIQQPMTQGEHHAYDNCLIHGDSWCVVFFLTKWSCILFVHYSSFYHHLPSWFKCCCMGQKRSTECFSNAILSNILTLLTKAMYSPYVIPTALIWYTKVLSVEDVRLTTAKNVAPFCSLPLSLSHSLSYSLSLSFSLSPSLSLSPILSLLFSLSLSLSLSYSLSLSHSLPLSLPFSLPLPLSPILSLSLFLPLSLLFSLSLFHTRYIYTPTIYFSLCCFSLINFFSWYNNIFFIFPFYQSGSVTAACPTFWPISLHFNCLYFIYFPASWTFYYFNDWKTNQSTAGICIDYTFLCCFFLLTRCCNISHNIIISKSVISQLIDHALI